MSLHAPSSRTRRPSSETGRRSHAVRAAVAMLVAIGLIAGLAACGGGKKDDSSASSASFQSNKLFGTLPPVGKPAKGGTITVSQITGSTPTYIFPIVPAASASAYTASMITNLYLPIYNGPQGATPTIDYSLSLANKPTFADGDKTVTIPMKKGFKWSDGKPVVADDLIFYIDLLKAAVKESPANWSQFTPGEFPETVVSATAKDDHTVVLKLNRGYNPGFFLNNQLQVTGNVNPIPSHAWNIAAPNGPHLDFTKPANAKKIYDYLAKQGGKIAGFASNPLWKIVDGPFKLKTFSATNGSYDLVPNPSYGGSPKPYASTIRVETYTGITPILNALKTGSLDIGGVDFSQIAQIPALKRAGYSVYGFPAFGWFGAIINFKNTTNHFNKVMAQPYVRQALAHLVDQNAYVKGIFKNAAVPAYGPVPSVPKTPFTPKDALSAPYPFNPKTAANLLKAHGWSVVPNGQTTCATPGTAKNQCGAGIPKGTPLKFTWFYLPTAQSPSSSLESEAFASQAKKVGINVELHSKTFDYQIANFNDADPSTAKHVNEWGVSNFGGFGYNYYPTSDGVFNTTGVFNSGAYSSKVADGLIEKSKFGSNANAVTAEAAFLTKDVPLLFMPNSDYIYAVNRRIGGTQNSFLALTELVNFPQFWYVNKK